MLPYVGRFGENKDVARRIRLDIIIPFLGNNETVILNFKGVESVTQSFIHALISDVIRKYGIDVLDESLIFKDCDVTIQKIISIVVDYMQNNAMKET